MRYLLLFVFLLGCSSNTSGYFEYEEDAGTSDSDSDTDVDSDSDSDTDVDSDSDVDGDTDVDSDSDSDGDDCPFECVSLAQCSSLGGEIQDEYACDGFDYCCELGDDTDTGELPDTDSASDSGDDTSVSTDTEYTPMTDCDGGKYDPVTDLCWEDPVNEDVYLDEHWDAVVYCYNLVFGGHDDWRAPFVEELRSLIRNCPATETGGECSANDEEPLECGTDEVCAYGCGFSTECYWAEELSGPCVAEFAYWTVHSGVHVNFTTGGILVGNPITPGFYVRCVRDGD